MLKYVLKTPDTFKMTCLYTKGTCRYISTSTSWKNGKTRWSTTFQVFTLISNLKNKTISYIKILYRN